jgi:hypothetical protein
MVENLSQFLAPQGEFNMAIPLWIPIAAAAAAGTGSMLSGMSGAGQMNDNIGNATGAIGDIKARLPGQSAQLLGELGTAYSPYTANAGADMDAFRSSVMGGGDFSYAPTEAFNYDLQGGIQQFMDPTVQDQIKAATGAVEGSAANAGGLFSSATGKSIADRAQRISQESWKDALQAAIQDRGFQYGVYGDDISRGREAVDFEQRQVADRTANLGQLAGMGQNAVTNLANQTADIRMGEFQGMNEADLAIANMMMQKQDDSFFGNLGNFLTGGGSALGSIASIMSAGGGGGAGAGGTP